MPILKEVERQHPLIHVGFCIPLSVAVLNEQASPLLAPVAGDTQPPLQWLLMVTAVAQADQGTSKSSFSAALAHLLQGSQFTRYWL